MRKRIVALGIIVLAFSLIAIILFLTGTTGGSIHLLYAIWFFAAGIALIIWGKTKKQNNPPPILETE